MRSYDIFWRSKSSTRSGPRGHELAGKKRPTLRDLARHAFVISPAGSTSRRLIEAAFLRAGLRLEIAMEVGGRMSMGW